MTTTVPPGLAEQTEIEASVSLVTGAPVREALGRSAAHRLATRRLGAVARR
jgi:hypothetical protein